MVSTTKSRPNHYEILGLDPSASSAEIARAFSAQAGMFHPRALGTIAETSIAFAALRDPVKRKAYDASLGLNPPPPSPSLMMWGGKSHFIGPAPGGNLGRVEIEGSPFVAPPADPPPQPVPSAEPGIGSVIANSLRALARPEPWHETRPAPALEQSRPPSAPPADVPSGLGPKIGRDDALGRSDGWRLGIVEDHPIAWKRPAIAAGALLGAVALLGAWLGVEAGNDAEPVQPDPAVTVALAPPQTRAAIAAPAPVPARGLEQARERPRRPAVADVRSESEARRPLPVAPDRQAQIAQSDPGPPAADLVEQAGAQASPATPAKPVAASLPLSNAMIARTIQRIGYACGQVASTSALEAGAPGVFKVSCTSGNSYQATPVRGRYRFRRLGGQ